MLMLVVFLGLSGGEIISITLIKSLSFLLGLVVSRNFWRILLEPHFLNKCFYTSVAGFARVFFLFIVCCSGDAMEKFRGELMALIGVGFPNVDVSVARLFRVDFLVGSALSAGCGGGVVVLCPAVKGR